jgi:hypothetical protein
VVCRDEQYHHNLIGSSNCTNPCRQQMMCPARAPFQPGTDQGGTLYDSTKGETFYCVPRSLEKSSALSLQCFPLTSGESLSVQHACHTPGQFRNCH